MSRRLPATLALSGALAGCHLIAPLDGLTGGDASTPADSGTLADSGTPVDSSTPLESSTHPDSSTPRDAADEDTTTDAPAPGDAASDAPVADASRPATPVAIVDVGAVTAPSGHAQQAPLVWLSGEQAWWLFYVDGSAPTTLAAVGSTDFRNWSPVGTITLPGPVTDGRNIAAFAGVAAGQDVLHVGVGLNVSSTDRRHLHARAHPASGKLQLDANAVVSTTQANVPSLDPDAPATALGTDLTVLDTSGWFQDPDAGGTGNEYAWLTTSPDPGGAWTPQWGPTTLLGRVSQYVNARAIVPLAGGSFFALWEAGDSEPDPSNVRFAVLSSGQWSAVADVFVASTQDSNDWGACSLGSAIHAVRHTSAGAWEHRVWSGSSFADGGAIPPLDSLAGTGAVVLCDGARVRVFAIALDPGNPLNETRWDGTAWSAWAEVVGVGRQRSYLSGSITPGGQVALVWTEPGDGGSLIAGALVPNGL